MVILKSVSDDCIISIPCGFVFVVCLSFSDRVVVRSHITLILAMNTIREGPKTWFQALDDTLLQRWLTCNLSGAWAPAAQGHWVARGLRWREAGQHSLSAEALCNVSSRVPTKVWGRMRPPLSGHWVSGFVFTSLRSDLWALLSFRISRLPLLSWKENPGGEQGPPLRGSFFFLLLAL